MIPNLGRAHIISSEPLNALSNSNGKMIGIGITPEGIEQNYVIYELMLEMAWRNEPVNLKEWFKLYQWRRYGGAHSNDAAANAWNILLETVYQSDNYQWSVTKVGSTCDLP
jgi:alpha-N-acetylglucosaminidase